MSVDYGKVFICFIVIFIIGTMYLGVRFTEMKTTTTFADVSLAAESDLRSNLVLEQNTILTITYVDVIREMKDTYVINYYISPRNQQIESSISKKLDEPFNGIQVYYTATPYSKIVNCYTLSADQYIIDFSTDDMGFPEVKIGTK